MPASIVGRDAELAALERFLAGIADGATVLVLEGEAGMGKTTLWRAAVELAVRTDLRTLEAQPAESEAELSFAGLGDLLDPVLPGALETLPAGQRSALERALVLEEIEGAAPDAHAVGVALLGVLRALVASGPVLVAVDDVQWLDAASAGALEYAGRRLRGERVGVLLARRSGLESPLVDELRRSLGSQFEEIAVGPLDPRSLHRVVEEHLGTALPRPLLAEVHQASGGNPFYALEIVRMLQRSGVSVEAGQPLPVPDSLHALVHGRLLALPSETRDLLLAAAAHAHPTLAITEAATGLSCAVGLTPALEARVVELDGERIRFTHPLLAAGAYELADRLRRREIHVRLAELLDDPEARAWQLAASVDEPDEAVASALEEASRTARARGAPRPAALLLERACELTPPEQSDVAIRRSVDAAFLHFESGDSRRAEVQLRGLIAPLYPGLQRAKAVVVLARIRLYEAPDEARELFEQVIREAADDPPTLALAHEGVAACCVWMFERFRDCLQHTEAALVLASELGDQALVADVLLSRLTAETVLGEPTAEATADRALALQSSAANLRILDQPLISLAENWIWIDLHARARGALLDLLRHARDFGDENGRPWALCLLGEVERCVGDLRLALELSREAQEAAAQSGLPLFGSLALALESMVRAQLGDSGEATSAAQRVLGRSDDRYAFLVASAALGHLALSLGAPDETEAHLEPCVGFVQDQGIVEPGVARFAIDRVEALVELGRVAEAMELLDWYEGNARRLERVSALANCARCRGLLAAQAGDIDDALVAYANALELHEQLLLPLDRGRTLLALGATQRRMKRRREARTTLEEGLAIFEHMGAALWAERARAELKRISGRAATPGALTPAEERVAALVAAGKTNKEVAAALFLSDRTVEGHLAHIFGKLGIRHRGEIAGVLQTQGIGAPYTGDSPVSAQPPAS
jgi:DNA-binding CsgD family transcriptional regulator